MEEVLEEQLSKGETLGEEIGLQSKLFQLNGMDGQTKCRLLYLLDINIETSKMNIKITRIARKMENFSNNNNFLQDD